MFGPCRFFGLFGRGEDFYVPWDCVQRFGDDIILIDKPFQRREEDKKAPPLGLSRDNTAKKPLIFRESRKNPLQTAIDCGMIFQHSAQGRTLRSVPQGWPGGGSLWRVRN